jgi:hypothetical protein
MDIDLNLDMHQELDRCRFWRLITYCSFRCPLAPQERSNFRRYDAFYECSKRRSTWIVSPQPAPDGDKGYLHKVVPLECPVAIRGNRRSRSGSGASQHERYRFREVRQRIGASAHRTCLATDLPPICSPVRSMVRRKGWECLTSILTFALAKPSRCSNSSTILLVRAKSRWDLSVCDSESLPILMSCRIFGGGSKDGSLRATSSSMAPKLRDSMISTSFCRAGEIWEYIFNSIRCRLLETLVARERRPLTLSSVAGGSILWHDLWVHKMSQSGLRQAVDRRLKRKVPRAVWKYLQEKQFVTEALNDPTHSDPVEWLAGEAHQLIQLWGAKEPAQPLMSVRRQRRQTAVPLRLAVTSELVAAKARNNQSLQAFRGEFLKGGLLKRSEVADWIQNLVGRVIYERAIILSIPKTTNLEFGNDGWECHPPISQTEALKIEDVAPLVMLEFATPHSKWVQKMPVGRDGALRILANLAGSLASTYAWQTAQATVFVLTGDVPLLSSNKVEIRQGSFVRFGSQGLRSLECLSRFVITVDSRTSPEEVAQLYKETRAKHFRLSRSPGKKHMMLASFASQYERVSHDVMTHWNRDYPEWKYHRYSIFARDVRVVVDRLLFGSSIDPRTLRFGVPEK